MEITNTISKEELTQIVKEIVRDELVRPYEDMEAIRRSPAAAIIRMEEELKAIRREMVTKEELREFEVKFSERIDGLESRMGGLEGRMSGLEGRMSGLEGRMSGLEGRINLLTGLMFVMLTLYGALVVKLIFFP
ncbi:MAG: hypothetical protein ONB05_05330 [candidate division KSB1 bacterium]|nr:hypothetical protein [candidate division KSB1 bacterium]